MTIYRFNLELLTPAFVAGTDKNSPEMRAASVRGELRYWWRAIQGASCTDTEALFKQEAEVFGSTGGGSPVSVRIVNSHADVQATPQKYFMLPHKSKPNSRRRDERANTAALKIGCQYELQLVTYPEAPLAADVVMALRVWSLLGGIGRRSRRMFGAVQITPRDAEMQQNWYKQPFTAETLGAEIKTFLTQAVGSSSQPTGGAGDFPTFPTLKFAHSWILVGGASSAYEDYEQANIELYSDLIGHGINLQNRDRSARLASPIHAQLRRVQVDNQSLLVPVFTMMRAKEKLGVDWKHVASIMRKAKSKYIAKTFWGGPDASGNW